VGIAILASSLVEGHHPKTTCLETVHEGEYVTNLSLNIKGNILESAEMEECLHSELFDGRMLNKRDKEGVAVLGNKFSKVMSRAEGIEVAIDGVEVVYFILHFLHSF